MKISIVTPSFNQAAFLKDTAESVLSQAGDFELEWLVIDGRSSDGSIDFLRSITDPRLRWISEKDAGQSDAINKGLAMATGDIVAWINSDDLYTANALNAVARAFLANPQASWLVGRYEIIDSQGVSIRPGIVRYKEKFHRHFSRRMLLRENFIPQPAVFWRRSFGRAVGPLDTSLHFTMDYDLWLRMAQRSDPLFVDQVLARFRVHEQSKTGVIDRRQFDEGYQVAKRYAGDDRMILLRHRISVEKIVLAYRLMRLIGK